MQKSRKQSSRGRRGGKKRDQGSRVVRIPAIDATPSFHHKFRFRATSAVLVGGSTGTVTRAQLMNLVSVATTTTNQYRIINAIKVSKIEVWGPPPALGSGPTSIQLEWRGNNAPSVYISDTPMGVDWGYISSKPPRGSNCEWWTQSNSTLTEGMFNLSGPIGMIVDVSVQVRLQDQANADAAENGTAAASTVGRMYYNYLSGFGNGVLIPEGGVLVLP